MPAYRAPKDTEVSTILPGGEEFRHKFTTKPLEVKDESLAAILDRLADDDRNPIRHARTDTKE